MTTHTFTVSGMTCQHCVRSVTAEVGDIPGVEMVDVDLASGRLEITAPAIDDDAVKAAVEEAGYALAPRGDLGLTAR